MNIPYEMRRKIIKQGHNTLTITLPSEWVKKLNLKAGDEINLIEKDNSVILNADERSSDKYAVINITNFTIPLMWRSFQGAYRSGCNEIKIIFDPSKRLYEDAYSHYTTRFQYAKLDEVIPQKTALAMIQGLVDRFIGMGIIETGKDYCIIKEMGELTSKEFDNSLRRIFLVILYLFDRTMDAIEKDEISNLDLCKEFHTLDTSVDRFVDYCCRVLNKINTSFPDDKKMLLFSTLYFLELVGDEFKYISTHLARSKKTVKDVLPFAEMIKEHFDMYYKLFYKFDQDQVIKFNKKDYEVHDAYAKSKERLHGHSKDMARHFTAISKLTLSLVELRIEMEF